MCRVIERSHDIDVLAGLFTAAAKTNNSFIMGEIFCHPIMRELSKILGSSWGIVYDTTRKHAVVPGWEEFFKFLGIKRKESYAYLWLAAASIGYKFDFRRLHTVRVPIWTSLSFPNLRALCVGQKENYVCAGCSVSAPSVGQKVVKLWFLASRCLINLHLRSWTSCGDLPDWQKSSPAAGLQNRKGSSTLGRSTTCARSR